MRISPSSIVWLAAASSAGVARGAEVYFLDNGFHVTTGQGKPVFLISTANNFAGSTTTTQTAHTFDWFVNQSINALQPTIVVTQVNLYVYATPTPTPVAGAFNTVWAATTQVTPTPTSAGGTVAPFNSAAILPTVADTQHTGPESKPGHLFGKAVPTPPAAEVRLDDSPESVQVLGQSDDSGSQPIIDTTLLSISNDSPTAGKVIVNDMARLLLEYPAKLLYFEILWRDATSGDGKSYSRYFAVVGAGDTAGYGEMVANPNITNIDPAMPEQTGLNGSDGGLNGNGPTTSPDPVSTITPSASTSTPTGSPMGGSDPQSVGHSSSALSTGAIAGIAVGAAVVGLALLAGLIFCLIRRRRRDRLAGSTMSPGSGYGNRATPELIAQKEGNAGVGVEVSPHSPYSDEGGMAGPTGGLRHSTARQEEMPLAGYGHADRAVSNREVGEDGGSFRGSQTGRMTPGRATPTAVRHLVEEGMTEDEIRRLEEEERELDHAIEQAGGRR